MLKTPFYRKKMSLDKFKLILKYLSIANNENAPNKSDENYDRFWKLRSLFETLVKNFKLVYNSKKGCVVNEML